MRKIIFLLLILFIITGCNNSEKTKEEVNNNLDNNSNNSETIESTTNINTNSKYQEEKIVEELVFSNASLMKIDKTCLFEVTVKNRGSDKVQFDHIKITLLDSENNSINILTGVVTYGTLNVNEEKVISSYYNGDIDKVYDVKYEIIKLEGIYE